MQAGSALRRLGALGAVVVAGLILAGAAPSAAADEPLGQLTAWALDEPGTHGTAFIVEFASDLAAGRVVLYVPAGFTVDLARPVGQKIGESFAVYAIADDLPDIAEGTVKTADPATAAADPAAQACAPGAHAAVWIAGLDVAGQNVDVRFFVDPTSGAEAALGAYKAVACLASPYVTPGGGPAQVQYLDLGLGLYTARGEPVIALPHAGTYTWRVFVTPYSIGTATLTTSATFEARARVAVPHKLTMRARYLRKTQRLVVAGSLRAGGKPRAGVRVWVIGGPRGKPLTVATRVKTRRDGTYVAKPRVVQGRRARVYDVQVFVEPKPLTCAAPSAAPAGCVADNLSPPPAQERQVRIPALPKKKR